MQIVPAGAFRISYTLDNDHPAIGTQAMTCTPTERMFVEEFAPARTYGFLRDLGSMRRNGLARGASLENAIGLGKRAPINGLRYRDEFVRHKILDLIGDLALLGRPVVGHVIARNAGHALNFELVVAIQRALGLERRPCVGATAAAAEPVVPGPSRGNGLGSLIPIIGGFATAPDPDARGCQGWPWELGGSGPERYNGRAVWVDLRPYGACGFLLLVSVFAIAVAGPARAELRLSDLAVYLNDHEVTVHVVALGACRPGFSSRSRAAFPPTCASRSSCGNSTAAGETAC